MPAGSVHDVKYLYVAIAGINKKGGLIGNKDRDIDYIKLTINNYNDNKAANFGFYFKPKEVNLEVVKNVIKELIALKLIKYEFESYELTKEGKKIASLIEQKKSEEIKIIFTKLLMENYSIFSDFLKKILKMSNGDGVPLPIITSEVYDRFNGELENIAENYINILNKYTKLNITFNELINNFNKIKLPEKKTDKIRAIQTLLEKNIISAAFSPILTSRRAYDFVRSRTTSLELTNYATINIDGFPVEVTYMISAFEPVFNYHTRIIKYLNETIYINLPRYEEISSTFKNAINNTYINRKDDFGYVKVSDLRDSVCRELKISDNLFDDYIKKSYSESPHWLSFTYAGAADKITDKRLPIVFEKPMREFFTLVRVNPFR